jgi:general secretion pathway protein D
VFILLLTEQRFICIMKLLLVALLIGISPLRAQASDGPEATQFISEVIPIRYAAVTEVAAVLDRMITNHASGTTAASNPALNSPSGPAESRAGSASDDANHLSRVVQCLLSQAALSGEALGLGQAEITVDERTNSLLVHATPRDIRKIKEIVSRLQHVLAQLLIEAAVIEVSLKDSETSSLSLFAGRTPGPDGQSSAGDVISSSSLPSVARWVPTAGTNAGRSQMSGFDYLAPLANDLDALLASVATNSRVRILQRPRIQTPEGTSVEIFVRNSRGYPTSGLEHGCQLDQDAI